MAFREIRKYQNIDVQSGGLATAEIPKTGTYMAEHLRILDSAGAGVTVADIQTEIDNVKFSVGGTDIIDATPLILYKLYSYYYGGENANELDGLLPIPFARDFMSDKQQAEVFGLGMQGINSFNVEIDYGTVTNVSKVEQYVEWRNVERPIGQHVRLDKLPRSFNTTGLQEVTDIPIERGAGTLAFHIEYDASGTTVLDSVEVTANSSEVMKLKPENAQFMAEKAGREWQGAGSSANEIFSVDFALSNDLTGFLSHENLTDLRLTLNWSGSAPGSYIIYREAVFGLGQNNG